MGGVQSVPRVMRSLPTINPMMFDVPLPTRRRDVAILHEQGRLSGLSKQGLARTLNASDIEMPEECARAGEVFIAPGVCGKPRTTTVVSPGSRITTSTPAAASASGAVAGMSRTTMLIAAAGAVGLIYYLGKRK
jgi:hypothetical protein